MTSTSQRSYHDFDIETLVLNGHFLTMDGFLYYEKGLRFLDQFWPSCSHGCIMITSQRAGLFVRATSEIRLESFSAEEKLGRLLTLILQDQPLTFPFLHSISSSHLFSKVMASHSQPPRGSQRPIINEDASTEGHVASPSGNAKTPTEKARPYLLCKVKLNLRRTSTEWSEDFTIE